MSSGVNKAILVGNLGADPELKFTQSGSGMLKFNLATSETWMDDGEKKEVTYWHRVTVWGKRGEALSPILHKGSRVYVEGRIETRSYDDDQGVKKYITEISAREIVLLDGKREGGDERGRSDDRGRGDDRARNDDRGGGRRDDRNDDRGRRDERPRSSNGGGQRDNGNGARANERKAAPKRDEIPPDDFGGGGHGDDDIPF